MSSRDVRLALAERGTGVEVAAVAAVEVLSDEALGSVCLLLVAEVEAEAFCLWPGRLVACCVELGVVPPGLASASVFLPLVAEVEAEVAFSVPETLMAWTYWLIRLSRLASRMVCLTPMVLDSVEEEAFCLQLERVLRSW